MYPKQRLFNHLMKNYNQWLRPVKNEEEVTEVFMDLALTFVNNLDEKQQILHTHIWRRFSWRDEFLTWDPEQFGNITSLVVPSTQVWIPDVAFCKVIRVNYAYNHIYARPAFNKQR